MAGSPKRHVRSRQRFREVETPSWPSCPGLNGQRVALHVALETRPLSVKATAGCIGSDCPTKGAKNPGKNKGYQERTGNE
jgi:hypothetical protein